MDTGAFFTEQLADIRIVVVFIASPDWPLSDLGHWPRVWVLDQRGVWKVMEFGWSRRARQLMCLLASYRRGLNGPTADRYFTQIPDDHESDDEESDDTPVAEGSGKSALGTLRKKLRATGIDDLAGLLEVPPGHRGSDPWRLKHAITDVELASRAVNQGEWEAAWLLTHAGDGRLVGVARERSSKRRKEPPWFYLRSRPQKRAIRLGVLPSLLVDDAEAAATAVVEHYADTREAPRLRMDPIEELLRGLSARSEQEHGHDRPGGTSSVIEADIIDAEVVEEEAGEAAQEDRAVPAGIESGSEPTTELIPLESQSLAMPSLPRRPATVGQASPYPAELPVPDSDNELVVPVRPLRASTRSSPTGMLALSSALILAIIAVIVLAIIQSNGKSSQRTPPPSSPVQALTGQHARVEEQTYVSDANTFTDPHVLNEKPLKIKYGTTVLVSCREYVPGPSSFNPYWWYRILSYPWHDRFAPANSFLNGDPASDYLGPHPHPPKNQHGYDSSVAVCGAGAAGGSVETPLRHTGTFADAATGAGLGPAIPDGLRVTVSCKVPSTAAASEPGGYAYRVSSAPWRDRFYAPSRAFRNAIPADSTQSQLVDPEVPNCPPS